MMVLPDGSVRYFSVRETARIQTFPDGFVFKASWTESMRQLGNAVPVMLARVVASSVATQLLHAQGRRIENLNQKPNQPERVGSMPFPVELDIKHTDELARQPAAWPAATDWPANA